MPGHAVLREGTGLTDHLPQSMLVPMSDKSEQSESTEDVKAKFREALERKNKQTHDTLGTGGPDSPHGTEDTHAHGAKREFRRKSGG